MHYVIIMIILGAANVPEQTILNSQASYENRASLLSIASLCSKMGGVFSSFICALLVIPIGIFGVWLVMGSVTMIITFIAAIILIRLKNYG